MSQIKFYLFGPPRLERDGQVLHINGRKALALAVYLAVTGQPQSRDGLATLFWPEFDQTSARANLRRELSHLRTIFGDETLQVAREQISLRRGVHLWLDVAEFHDHWQQCQPQQPETPTVYLPQLQEAVRLYSADFLAGFTLPACPAFDEWQFFQSEGYRQTLALVLEALVLGHQRQGVMEAAIAYAQRRLSLDSLSEPAHRQLITLYAQSGQLTAALRQYERCVQMMRAELGAAPEAETTRLIEQIRHKQANEGMQAKPTTNRGSLAQQASHEVRHNLPTQTTLFVGRNDEIAEIQRLLCHEESCRLLTLVGPGGIGKTRLALATAAQLFPAFPDGVYFVGLTPVGAVEFIVSAIAEALHFTFHGKLEPKEQLLDHLRQRRLLLVMDNFEQLLDSADLLSEILRGAPAVTLLVTSRERLYLQEEWIYAVQGLSFPTRGEQVVEVVSNYSAVELFLQRARQANASFVPSASEVNDIIRICQLVEGMPLGLELAAPWIRSLSCGEIAQEIQQSLDFLTTPLRNLPERHRHMRVVFAQSWQRLSPAEQAVLQGLSVFRGGCTRHAAEQVTGATLPLLSSLVDKAWLRRTASGRYEVHELIRQFAETQVTAVPDAIEQARQHHQDYFISFLETRTAGIKGVRQKEIINEIKADMDNIRLVWRQIVETGDAQAIERAAECLFVFYLYNSGHFEGQAAFQQAVAALTTFSEAAVIEQPGELIVLNNQENLVGFLLAIQAYFLARTSGRQVLPEQAIARLLEAKPGNRRKAGVALAFLTWAVAYQGRIPDSMRYAEQALALSRETGDPLGEWWSLIAFGSNGVRANPVVAEDFLKQALAVSQKSGDPSAQGFSYQNLGSVAVQLGKYRDAAHFLAQSITLFEELGNIQGLGSAFMRAGVLSIALGDYAGAIQNLQQAQSYFNEAHSVLHIDICRVDLGVAYRLYGDSRQAELNSRMALATFQAMNDPAFTGYCLLNLGCLAFDQGDLRQAEQLQRDALDRWQQVGYEACVAEASRCLGYLMVASGEQRYAEARGYCQQALALATKHQIAPVALDACMGVAQLLAQTGALAEAVELLGLVEQHDAASFDSKEKARHLLLVVTEQLPLAVTQAAQARGQGRALWVTVQELIAKLD